MITVSVEDDNDVIYDLAVILLEQRAQFSCLTKYKSLLFCHRYEGNMIKILYILHRQILFANCILEHEVKSLDKPKCTKMVVIVIFNLTVRIC